MKALLSFVNSKCLSGHPIIFEKKECNYCAKYWIIIYNEAINVLECWMNLYHNCFKYDNYFRRGRYLFDNNDNRAKILGDGKPKHYHIYMFTKKQNKKP